MPANYLHGVETIEIERGPRPVRTVKSAVIGLIGAAPIGAVNVATLSLSEKDAAAFGPQLPGFTIPQALDAIYDHGAGTVIVINVLDPAIHKTAVANEAVTFDASTDRVKLAAFRPGTGCTPAGRKAASCPTRSPAPTNPRSRCWRPSATAS